MHIYLSTVRINVAAKGLNYPVGFVRITDSNQNMDFQGSSDKPGLSSFMEGHLALASAEQ